MKLEITLEDYEKAGEEFWPKYFYVAKELGEGAKPEQVLKVMESLAGVAMKNKVKNKIGPFGALIRRLKKKSKLKSKYYGLQTLLSRMASQEVSQRSNRHILR